MSDTDQQPILEDDSQAGSPTPPNEPAESPAAAPPAAEPDAAGDAEPDSRSATPPAPGAMLDLSLGQAYWGRRLIEIDWNWPSAVRVALLLCDLVQADPAAGPLLPGHITIVDDDRLQIDVLDVGDAIPFVAPEVAAGAMPTQVAAVFNIAAVIYYLLADAPPLGNIGRIDADLAATPAAFRHVLIRALAVDPRLRTPTPDDLRAGFYAVIDPPAWYESHVLRLPIDDEARARLNDLLNRMHLAWYRLRDRIPWQRMGKARKRLAGTTGNPRLERGLTAAGILIVLLIYIVLFTDVI